MTDKIFLRLGAWYKSTHKALVSDIDITALVVNPSAQYPEIDNPFGDATVAVYKRKTVLTDTQIKSLPTTGIELVPAPGVGKCILPIAAGVVLNILGGAYANVTDSSFLLVISGNYLSGPMQTETQLIVAINGQRSNFTIPNGHLGGGLTYASTIMSTFEIDNTTGNQPLLIKDDFAGIPNYTGGHVNNTLEVTVVYAIMDI